MKPLLWALAVTSVICTPVFGQEDAEIDALIDALAIPEILDIMQIESAKYGATIGADMLPNQGGNSWQHIVASIHNPDDMLATLKHGFTRESSAADIAPLMAFFASETGRTIVDLEVAARAAFLDSDIEQTARQEFRAIEDSQDARLSLITDYVELNDLIEYNVVGALNSNYSFYLGLVEGGAFKMSDEEMLAEVWSTEIETRADTREWMFAYLLMAYQPLELTQLQAYIDLSTTVHGRALNRALFAGFDDVFTQASYALGRAVAHQLTGEDL